MINLNLVPEQHKKNQSINRTFSILNGSLVLLSVIIAVYAGLMFGIKLMLNRIISEVNVHTQGIANNSEGYNKKVKDINEQLQYTEGIQSGFKPWTCLISEILKCLERGVVFTNISINKDQSQAVIQGNAKQRDSLLSFKSKLEKSELIENVDLPLQNLLVKEDLGFTLTLKLKSDRINIPSE